jgi:hypothetical protein
VGNPFSGCVKSETGKKRPSAKIDGTRSRALRGATGVKNGVKSGGFWQPLSQDVALCCNVPDLSRWGNVRNGITFSRDQVWSRDKWLKCYNLGLGMFSPWTNMPSKALRGEGPTSARTAQREVTCERSDHAKTLPIPSPAGAMHFSVPISAQKLCEHFRSAQSLQLRTARSLVKGLTRSTSATLRCIAWPAKG